MALEENVNGYLPMPRSRLSTERTTFRTGRGWALCCSLSVNLCASRWTRVELCRPSSVASSHPWNRSFF